MHAEKGEMECKYWLLVEEVEIKEAFNFNMNPATKREMKKNNISAFRFNS